MSEETRNRLAVLQHKRRQSSAQAELLRITEDLGMPSHKPMDPDMSLRIQDECHAKLEQMRTQGQLHRSTFRDLEPAIDVVMSQLNRLGIEMTFKLSLGAHGSGFFTGSISREFLKACLSQKYEAILIINSNLESGAILDVIVDDPLQGNAFEVEWW